MGLDVGVDGTEFGFSFSYSGFHAFRQALAKHALNIDLDDMEGFGGGEKWKKIKSGLVVLLNHSDCDGDITPNQASTLLAGLKAYVRNSKTLAGTEVFDNKNENDYYWGVIETWIEACELAVKFGNRISFG